MASSTATNSKYLDYAGLSHLKTVLDGRYAPISRTFITKRDEIDILTGAQITAYADLSTSSAGQSAFKLLKSGSYNVARSGSSELLINLGTNTGSASALEFLTNYTHESRLKVRKIIDSNRVSGGFKELAWYSDIPTKVSQLPNDAGYTTANGHTHSYLPLAGGTMTGTITSQSIIPAKTHTSSDTAYSLGSSSKQFNTTYTRYVDTVSQYNLRLKAGGVEHLNMLSGNVNVTANILPTTNNKYNLGSSSAQWNNIYGKTLYENGTSLASKYSASGHTHSYVDSAGTASHAAVADYATYAYYIATSNVVTTETINTLTDEEAEVVPAIPTGQIVISDSLRQFWVNVRNIIEDNEFVCASALTDLNTRLNNINASINLAVPVNSTTKYNILGSPSTSGELNTAYCNSSVYMQGNNLYATSDERLKNFKEDIEVDLEKLRKLPKKYFTWKGENMMDIGTSAQELLKLYPELVSYDSVNDIYAVDYVKLSVIALAAVDTLYDRLKSTEDRLKVIEDKLAKL